VGASADIDLHGFAEAVFRRGAGKAGGAVEVLAHRDRGVVLLGDLQQPARDVDGVPGGGDVLVIGGAEPRQDDRPKMAADPRRQLAEGDRRQVAEPGREIAMKPFDRRQRAGGVAGLGAGSPNRIMAPSPM
jgi:hypothetical protein